MGVSRALRRFAGIVQPTKTGVVWRNCTVTTVTPSASLDGVAAAFISDGTNTFPAPYLAAYTPTAGHMVSVRFIDGSPLILGRVVGLPNL